jgi:hypothetical protein
MGNFLSSHSGREHFNNPLRPERPPISGQEGLNALQRAEGIDQYRLRVSQSPINRIARSGQYYLPAPFIGEDQPEIPRVDPLEPWPSGQVIWMDPSADGGLPHTRPPYYICISRTFPAAHLPQTMLHERVHVSQRLHTTAWEKLFQQVWNMKPWVGSLPSDIQVRRRINPDLNGFPDYIWREEWVPLALFKSSSQPKLTEIMLVWWNAKTRTLFREPPPGWVSFFGSLPSGEHPFELAAYLIAENPSSNAAYNVLKPRLNKLPADENI